MKINIFGKNIRVTEGIKMDIEKKIGKLDKYLSDDAEVDVTLSVDKDNQKVEVTIPVKGNIIRAEESSSDMYATIDLVEEVIERRLVKFKKKIIDKKKVAKGSFKTDFFDVDYDYEDDEEDAVQIVKTKRFGIKPMNPEEACIQMDLIGHSFFVFLNAETEEVNVVYKRKKGTYGLIEPELD